MSQAISRREFMKSGTSTAAAITVSAKLSEGFPTIMKQQVKPIIISSANGNRYKNGGTVTCVEKAFGEMMQGSDVLDALIAGVNINELDPADTSVGYGGLPNAEGVVQLDASCMHGPKRRAGAVAALEGVRTPSLVAKAVMETTDHHLLVGSGAQDFAQKLGFKIENDLNTEGSRKAWLEWKRRIDPQHYLDPTKREDAMNEASLRMIREGLIDPQHYWGTINCNGVNSKGEICGVTTTSGLAWKIPGRVGDSPILGAGLYVDGEAGAAGSTGRGEANLYSLASFSIVEQMRLGKHPKDAAIEVLNRVKINTVEKRLLNSRGTPNFNLNFYCLNRKGEYAGVALYGGRSSFAICTEQGPKTIQSDYLLEGNATD